MTMAYKGTLLFQSTTQPTVTAIAAARTGGWSESHWNFSGPTALFTKLRALAPLRAAFLPTQASIIGYRIEGFSLEGNKQIPSGASSGRFNFPGTFSAMNAPQDSLMMSGQGAGVANVARFTVRCLPDTAVVNGELANPAGFAGFLGAYSGELVGRGWGFVGRVRGTTARVVSIHNSVVTLSQAVGGVADQSFLRFLRVYDDAGNPIKGSYSISLIAGNLYTVRGLAGVTMINPSGNARLDEIAMYTYGAITYVDVVVRKIGGPFEKYRGRASARR